MNIIASLRSTARNFLGIPNDILPRGIMPTASLPTEETQLRTRPVNVIAAPVAPVAGTLKSGNPPELDDLIKSIATVRKHMPTAQASGRPLPPSMRSGPTLVARPQAKAVEPMSPQNVPQHVPVDDDDTDTIYEQFLKLLETLKKQITPDADEAGEEEEAKALHRRGQRATARAKITALCNRLITRSTAQAKTVERKTFAQLDPLQKMAKGFSEMPAVAALSASLSSPAKRAATVLAPVGGSRAEIIKPTTASAIMAEIKRNDDEQRKFGFDAARHSKHLKLTLALHAELKKTRP